MKPFQLVIFALFILFALIGTLMFAGIIPTPGGAERKDPVTLSVWGTLPYNKLLPALETIQAGDKVSINYTEKEAGDLEIDLLRSAAGGAGPDLVIFPHPELFGVVGSLYLIPYQSSFNDGDFKSAFIEGSEIFLGPDGIYALPLLVDPVVMYWNRDIFNDARITEPPKTWAKVIDNARTLTKRDERGRIVQSAIALGEADNISHFKDIVSLLLMQVGDSIVSRNTDGTLALVLGRGEGSQGGPSPAYSALSFYRGFSDPLKEHYSWNSSLDTSFNAFTQGNLALYLGPASDYEKIKARNPLLNFSVTGVPQLENASAANFGTFYGVGIARSSQHFNEAFQAAFLLSYSDKNNSARLSEAFGLAPVSRTLLSEGSQSGVNSVFYNAAVVAKSWLDPDPVSSQNVFRKMVRDIVAGLATIESAIATASRQLGALFQNT